MHCTISSPGALNTSSCDALFASACACACRDGANSMHSCTLTAFFHRPHRIEIWPAAHFGVLARACHVAHRIGHLALRSKRISAKATNAKLYTIELVLLAACVASFQGTAPRLAPLASKRTLVRQATCLVRTVDMAVVLEAASIIDCRHRWP